MKDISLHKPAARWMTLAFIFSTTFVMAQTWQNTLDTLQDEMYSAGVYASKSYFSCGSTNSFFVSSNNAHRILISKYDKKGISKWDRVIYDKKHLQDEFVALDMQAGYDYYIPSQNAHVPPPPCTSTSCGLPASNGLAVDATPSNKYFYLTGYWTGTSVNNHHRLYILKVNNTGKLLWMKSSFEGPTANMDETGVSVESCPNGDVIAVSSVSDSTGDGYMAVTRMDSAGVLVWRNYYKPVKNPGEVIYMIPHQSCMITETSNNYPTGVAVTGEFAVKDINSGSSNTYVFVSRIDYGGTELWHKNYYSPIIGNVDAGWDIMIGAPDSAVINPNNLVITGLSIPPGLTQSTFVMRVNINTGAFNNAWKVFDASGAGTNYGQSIYPVTGSTTDAVVCGGKMDPFSLISNTYLLQLNTVTGIIAFANSYPTTNPFFSYTESVVSSATGYYISTNSIGTGRAAQAISTNLSGVFNSNCITDPWPIFVPPYFLKDSTRCILQICEDLFADKVVVSKKVVPPHDRCYGGKLTEEDGESGVAISIYPNPIGANQALNVTLQNATPQTVTVEVISLDGRILHTEQQFAEAGEQTLHISTGDLSAGTYLIRLQTDEQVTVQKFMVVR